MSLGAGEVFAGYTVVRLLGSGGMGEVYLAKHPRLPRQDAIKVLPAALSADTDFRARFEREADLAATLWHPHIVGVHDRGEDNGRLWIAMDYVEGHDAAHDLRENYPNGMPTDDVLDIITAIADALDYAHERHLLHRDVKPANILLTDAPRRRILLTDFGIARRSDDSAGLTATNMTIGSVAYTAPEQLMGEHLDGRADQYSLAATAYHLLTGAPPFTHTNPTVVISRHLNTPAPTLNDTRPDLAAYSTPIAKALAKNPHDRYDNCQHFATALRHTLTTPDTEHIPATPPVTAGPTERLQTSRPIGEPPPVYVSAWQTESSLPAATFETAEPTMAAAWSQVPADDEPLPYPAPYPDYPLSQPQPIPPDRPPSASRTWTWALAGVAAVIVLVVTLVFALSGGGDETASPSPRPPTSGSAGPTTGSASATGSPGTPGNTQNKRSIPPTVQGPDSTGDTCPTGYAITGRDGWGSASVRGNDATTCAFAGNVLNAYWEAGPPSRTSRTIVAAGPVRCPGGPSCSGDDYVVNCGMEGTNPWITCRGVGDALVYLF